MHSIVVEQCNKARDNIWNFQRLQVPECSQENMYWADKKIAIGQCMKY